MYGSGGTTGRDLEPHELHGQLKLPESFSGADQLSLPGLGAGIDFLRRPHRRAIFHASSGNRCQHMFERAQNPNRVEIIVIPDVRDAKQLALSSRPARSPPPRQTLRETPSRSCSNRFPPARRSPSAPPPAKTHTTSIPKLSRPPASSPRKAQHCSPALSVP